MFQMISRRNDSIGRPYRLIMIYDENGELQRLIETQTDTPSILFELKRKGHKQLPTIRVSTTEYNRFKADYIDIGCTLIKGELTKEEWEQCINGITGWGIHEGMIDDKIVYALVAKINKIIKE